MEIIKCRVCNQEISILEDMTQFACPYCKTVQSRQELNQGMQMTETVVKTNSSSEGIHNFSFNNSNTNKYTFDEEQHLKNVFSELENGQFKYAAQICDLILDYNATNYKAYLGKLMSELEVKTQRELAYAKPFEENINYKKCMQFADDELKQELCGYLAHIRECETLLANRSKKNIKKIVISSIGSLVVICLIVLFYVDEINSRFKIIEYSRSGDTVTLGEYKDSSIKWIVQGNKYGDILLVCKEGFEYDGCYQGNVEKWLEEDILEESFSFLEKKRITKIELYEQDGELVYPIIRIDCD